MGRHDQPATHLLTGDRGSGKSTVVQSISDRLGTALAGILSRPVHLASGERSGIDAVLLSGGTEAGGSEVSPVPLARVNAAALAEISGNGFTPEGAGDAVPHYRLAAATDPLPPGTSVQPVGPYQFSVEALSAVNEHLRRIVAGADTPTGAGTSAAKVIVIDEVGPLELRHKAGFWPGLSSLLADLRPLILVVRPDLVDELTGCTVAAGRRVAAVHVVTRGSISATADAIVTAVTEESVK